MWHRIEGDWARFRDRARHEWSRLTDDQLEEIDGRRDRLARRVRDAYGVTDEEADKQVAVWEDEQRRWLDAARLDSDPSRYPPARHADAVWNGSNAATETRNESGGRDPLAERGREPGTRDMPRTGTPRTGTGGHFENEGEEFGEHDRAGGAGMPGNQGGGRDGGGTGRSASSGDAPFGASSGGRKPGATAPGGEPPGSAGRGSG
jgi:uncharacterized protein YjbJ (UPF0337 family)